MSRFFRFSLFLLFSLSLLLVFSCQRSSADPAIVEVGGVPIYQSGIEAEIAQLPAHRQQAMEDSAARRSFIRELVEGRLLAQDARNRFGGVGSVLRSRAEEMQRRELCRYTQNIVIAQRLGYAEPELLNWISTNRALLGADTALPISQLERRAAESKKLENAPLEEFYREHAQRWVLPWRVELSAIETSSSAKLKQAVAALKRGESFTDVASRYSEHLTASRGGYFGWITEIENHFLMRQYQGMERFLFGDQALPAGELTPTFTDGTHHIIVKVDSSEPRRQRTFEEVEEGVRNAYLLTARKQEFKNRTAELKKIYRIEWLLPSDSTHQLSPEDVLITMAKKPWILGADLLSLKQEYNPDHHPSDSIILDLLLEWRIWESYGIDLGLDEKVEYQQFRDNLSTAFWLKVEIDSVLGAGYGAPDAEIRQVMEKYPSLFEKKKPSLALVDASLLLLGDPEELRAEWLMFPARYGVDSVTAYGEKFSFLFDHARQALSNGVRHRFLAELENSIGVRWIDTTWKAPKPEGVSGTIALADRLLKNRTPALAVELLSDALALYKSPEPRRDTLTYLLGRSLMDASRPLDASRTFARYSLLYPQGKDLCRVLFMEGFLLENNLKLSQEALIPLQRLLAECPDSELREDAAYIVEDIQCDHCKTAEFMKSLGGDTISLSEGEGEGA